MAQGTNAITYFTEYGGLSMDNRAIAESIAAVAAEFFVAETSARRIVGDGTPDGDDVRYVVEVTGDGDGIRRNASIRLFVPFNGGYEFAGEGEFVFAETDESGFVIEG